LKKAILIVDGCHIVQVPMYRPWIVNETVKQKKLREI